MPSLPKMSSLMRRDDMQTRGQAEANAWYERIRETYTGKIQVGVHVQEGAHFMMRLDEVIESIFKSWRFARANAPRRLYPEEWFNRRFQITHKPPPDQSRHCRTGAMRRRVEKSQSTRFYGVI